MELHERIERISGLNLLDSAIHSDCVVTSSLILQDGSKIPSRTLADTGCTRDNFMSESHFLAHPILQQYVVQHPTNTIDLATHGSTATVSQYISIVIEIVHRGKPIRCKILVGVMKGLRYDLVLGLTVLASHYTDVLLDLLQFQLTQPRVASTSSFSMMAAHHALQGTEFPAIHPQMLHNWHIDHRSLDLYRQKPRTFVANPQLNQFPPNSMISMMLVTSGLLQSTLPHYCLHLLWQLELVLPKPLLSFIRYMQKPFSLPCLCSLMMKLTSHETS